MAQALPFLFICCTASSTGPGFCLSFPTGTRVHVELPLPWARPTHADTSSPGKSDVSPVTGLTCSPVPWPCASLGGAEGPPPTATHLHSLLHASLVWSVSAPDSAVGLLEPSPGTPQSLPGDCVLSPTTSVSRPGPISPIWSHGLERQMGWATEALNATPRGLSFSLKAVAPLKDSSSSW